MHDEAGVLDHVAIGQRIRAALPTRGVRGYVTIGVLCVALGLTISLQARGGDQRPIRYAYWGPILPTDAALVRATTARIQAPPGFVRTSRCFLPIAGSINVCFRRDPSVVLSDAKLAEVVRATGATSVAGASCDAPWRLFSRRELDGRVIVNCTGLATAGPVQLSFLVTSVLRLTAASVAPSRRPDRDVPAGTQVMVTIDAVHHARPSNNYAVEDD